MPADVALPTASWGRRILALVVDWLACYAVGVLVLGPDRFFGAGSGANVVLPLLFVVESTLLGCTLGGSFGQVVTGLRVVRVDGGGPWVEPLRMLARQALILLVIPPLVFRPDGRGLHDLVAGSAVVRRADLPAGPSGTVGRAG